MPTQLPQQIPTVRELVKGFAQVGRIWLARQLLRLVRVIERAKKLRGDR